MPNGAALFVQAAAQLGLDTIFTLVGDHLNDHRAFGYHLATVEAERRHLAFWVYPQVIVAILELLGFQVDLHQIIGQPRLQKRNVRGKRTGTGRIIQFHRNFLPLDHWLWETGRLNASA